MSYQNSSRLRHRDEDVASASVSRVIVLGFLTAGALGLLAGVAWVCWHMFARFAA